MLEQTELTQQIVLARATEIIRAFAGHTIDVLHVAKPEPTDTGYAVHLAKVISKLSLLLGNMLEYRAVSELNYCEDWAGGCWIRQDPGFPDALFVGELIPAPGIEIKTWFPLSTEITARFKDSITHFDGGQTNVAMLAWLPEYVIFGKPQVIDVWIDTAKSVAEARDKHYHDPPDYLVFEPEDTTERTSNLQQTNVNGYKFQDTPGHFTEAVRMVNSWGTDAKTYSHRPDYQEKLRQLLGTFKYRLDTNFAKMDRIEHPSLEEFKTKLLNTEFRNRTIAEWASIIGNPDKPVNTAEIAKLIQ